MARAIEKVTAFIVRGSPEPRELLLFEHPFAGIQIPAGTVEDHEAPEEAVVREVAEETGLEGLPISRYLGCQKGPLPDGYHAIAHPTKVYARPNDKSFDWAFLPKGVTVQIERRAAGFSQVKYEEYDDALKPHYVTMRITGWVPDHVLVSQRDRHFFLLECPVPTQERWEVLADNHTFTLFWAPLEDLPRIVEPQDQWLTFLPGHKEDL